MTGSKALLFIAALTLAPPCLAADAPPPPNPLVASCPMPPGVWFNPGELRTPDQFAAAARRVQDFLTASRAARDCLRGYFRALEADWKAAAQPPDPVVVQAVADVVRGRHRYDEAVLSGYNQWAEGHNYRLAADDPARAPIVEPLAMPSDDADAAVLPPPGRLTLPSAAIGTTHDCSRFYTLASKRAGETGRVTVGYDVGADGTILNPHIVTPSGFANLDAATMACVTTQWRNTPAIDKGVVVASPGHQATIVFSIW